MEVGSIIFDVYDRLLTLIENDMKLKKSPIKIQRVELSKITRKLLSSNKFVASIDSFSYTYRTLETYQINLNIRIEFEIDSKKDLVRDFIDSVTFISSNITSHIRNESTPYSINSSSITFDKVYNEDMPSMGKINILLSITKQT